MRKRYDDIRGPFEKLKFQLNGIQYPLQDMENAQNISHYLTQIENEILMAKNRLIMILASSELHPKDILSLNQLQKDFAVLEAQNEMAKMEFNSGRSCAKLLVSSQPFPRMIKKDTKVVSKNVDPLTVTFVCSPNMRLLDVSEVTASLVYEDYQQKKDPTTILHAESVLDKTTGTATFNDISFPNGSHLKPCRLVFTIRFTYNPIECPNPTFQQADAIGSAYGLWNQNQLMQTQNHSISSNSSAIANAFGQQQFPNQYSPHPSPSPMPSGYGMSPGMNLGMNPGLGAGITVSVESSPTLPFIVMTNENQFSQCAGILLKKDLFENAVDSNGNNATSEISWYTFANTLQIHFLKATRQDNSCMRPLSINDFRYLQQKHFGGRQALVANDFEEFWKCFSPSLHKIRHQKIFWRMYIEGFIFGFLSKTEATELLIKEQPGTFLIRFSETNPGKPTVAYVKDLGVISHMMDNNEQKDQKSFPLFLSSKDSLRTILQSTTTFQDLPINLRIKRRWDKNTVIQEYVKLPPSTSVEGYEVNM
eukprot:TRINITY_DN6482_c0_g1_i1.p1 TRINITY_DN6482_c0_g1~~TRINITY_DN6482_c0_g1_i1.p1  ORF type:complete len:579 (-),score=231.57 TRINITY_DN6482_c0_g1_i1:113-1717(-)